MSDGKHFKCMTFIIGLIHSHYCTICCVGIVSKKKKGTTTVSHSFLTEYVDTASDSESPPQIMNAKGSSYVDLWHDFMAFR